MYYKILIMNMVLFKGFESAGIWSADEIWTSQGKKTTWRSTADSVPY